MSLPSSPNDEVVATTAQEHVGALRAEQRVVTGAAVGRQVDDSGRRGRGGHAVVAAQGVDDEGVVGPFRAGDVDQRRQSDHARRGAGAEDVDDVVAVGAVDDDDVGCRVAGGATDGAGEAPVELDDVGAGQVVDDRGVGAAQCVHVDRFDVVEVHDDGADVAGEPHPAAVGGRLEDLGGAAAVEQHAVGAGLSFHDVAAVARIPLEDVVAGAQEPDVVALLAVDDVIADTTQQQIDAVAAQERVVADAAEQAGSRQRPVRLVESDRVVAALAEHLDQPDVGHRRRATRHRDRAAIDQDHTGGGAADLDVVVKTVTEDAEHAARRRELCRHSGARRLAQPEDHASTDHTADDQPAREAPPTVSTFPTHRSPPMGRGLLLPARAGRCAVERFRDALTCACSLPRSRSQDGIVTTPALRALCKAC